jgi:hypothetical protein
VNTLAVKESIPVLSLGVWRAAFLDTYPKVKEEIVAVLLELDSAEAVKGHISTNLRKRDSLQRKSPNTQHQLPLPSQARAMMTPIF